MGERQEQGYSLSLARASPQDFNRGQPGSEYFYRQSVSFSSSQVVGSITRSSGFVRADTFFFFSWSNQGFRAGLLDKQSQ